MKEPLVSVVISTYNSQRFIRGRLENLITQTLFRDTEIIVVNSGSQQDEESIVQEYAKVHSNIRYLRTDQRETIYKAWNRGIAVAKGKFVTNANTDDRLRKDAFEILSKALQQDEGVGMVYADQYITDIPEADFAEVVKKKRFHRPGFSRLGLLAKYIVGSQSMWRATIHASDGIWFDESYEVAGDYDFVCRIAELYAIRKVSGVLGVYYRANDNSNKEYADSERTERETIAIQDIYARRYLGSLSSSEKFKLRWKAKFISNLPDFAVQVIRGLVELLAPGVQILPKVYWCWFGSILAEQQGDSERALRFCQKYQKRKQLKFIQNQYNRLLRNR